MKFTTRMPPTGDSYDNKLVMTHDDLQAWLAAGRPAMAGKQLSAFARSLAYAYDEDPAQVVALTRTIVTARDREADVIALASTAGEDPDRARIMAGAEVDPELKALWLAQLSGSEPQTSAPTVAGPNPDEAKIMLHADPELRAMWLSQEVDRRPPGGSAPLGMDDERYQLHTQAKQLAAQKLARDPRLSEADAYSLAALEIEDAKTLGPI